jgi:LacI family transcriptional regulator
MQRSPTMADVAKLAGVGTMTVSRLLSGTVTVSEETAKRIHQAIQQLNYQPNEVARSLRGLKTRTIGVIVPYLYDPFFAYCAQGIATVAREHEYSVILTTSAEDPEREEREAIQMLRRHVEGMVIIPAMQQTQSYLGRPEYQDARIVTLDRPAPMPRFDSVLVENKSGATLAVQHLVNHGHKRIVCIGLSLEVYTMKMRHEGYLEALRETKLKPEAYLDCSAYETIVPALAEILAKPDAPTAFFCTNNLTMRSTLLALNELGVSIPKGVAIVGFDDFELAAILNPTLTVVRQPSQELGSVGATLLFKRLNGSDEIPETGERVVLPVELVVRRSCGCGATAAIDEGSVPAKPLHPAVIEPGLRHGLSGR